MINNKEKIEWCEEGVKRELNFESIYGHQGSRHQLPIRFNPMKESNKYLPDLLNTVKERRFGLNSKAFAELKNRETPFYRSGQLFSGVPPEWLFTINPEDDTRYLDKGWENMPIYLFIEWTNLSNYGVTVRPVISIHFTFPNRTCKIKPNHTYSERKNQNPNEVYNKDSSRAFDIRIFPCVFSLLDNDHWPSDPETIANEVAGEVAASNIRSKSYLPVECFGQRKEATQEAYSILEREGIIVFQRGQEYADYDGGNLLRNGYVSVKPENKGSKGAFRISEQASIMPRVRRLVKELTIDDARHLVWDGFLKTVTI